MYYFYQVIFNKILDMMLFRLRNIFLMNTLGPAVVAAAAPLRTTGGGYRLVNAFRYATGSTVTGSLFAPGRPQTNP
jgi:hypothetical protein